MYLYDFIFFSPDELPFPITDELLKLPGYKPKPRPPTLPPKERQRRHSDSVTTLTDSGVRRHSDLVATLTATAHSELKLKKKSIFKCTKSIFLTFSKLQKHIFCYF